MQVCKNCGNELNPNAKFCNNCGTPVEAVEETPSQASYTPPEQEEGSYVPPQQEQSSQGTYVAPQQDQPSQGTYVPPQQDQPSQGAYTPPQQDQPSQGAYTPPQQDQPSQGAYTPPQQGQPSQGGYVPPQQGQGAYAPVPPAKAKKSKTGLFIGLGVGGLVIIALVVFLLLKFLGGGGAVNEELLGLWYANEVDLMGTEFSAAEVYEQFITLDFEKGGKVEAVLEGLEEKGKWKLKEEELNIVLDNGIKLAAVFKGDEIIIDEFLVPDFKVTFRKNKPEIVIYEDDDDDEDEDEDEFDLAFVGVWYANSLEVEGMEFTVFEMFDGDYIIDIKDDGFFNVKTEYYETDGGWNDADGLITLTTSDFDVSKGVIENDSLIIEDLFDSGMKAIFTKTRPEFVEEEEEEDIWNGVWFGHLYVYDGFGEDWEGTHNILNAVMDSYVDENGEGFLSIYAGLEVDILYDIDYESVNADIAIDLSDELVYFDGYFFNMEFPTGEFDMVTRKLDVKGTELIIWDTYTDPDAEDETGFKFEIYLRSPEASWDDVIEADDIMPPGLFEYLDSQGYWDDGDGGESGSYDGDDTGGYFTRDELYDIFEDINASTDDFTYEEIRDNFFGGIEGVLFDEDSDRTIYIWLASDEDYSYVEVYFRDHDDYNQRIKTSAIMNN